MVGPVADDPGWQAREGTGFDTSQLMVDGERQGGTGPAGNRASRGCRTRIPPVAWRARRVWHARTLRPAPFGRAARGRTYIPLQASEQRRIGRSLREARGPVVQSYRGPPVRAWPDCGMITPRA